MSAVSLLLLLLLSSLCSPAFGSHVNSSIRPLVLWHGLGDSHSSPGMLEFERMIRGIHPGVFIHSIYLERRLDKDKRAGFYGNVDDQVEFAAQELAGIPELRGGFDALGLSQGGQFLRAYVERYNTPSVHNLITFGSQHMGVSDLPLCAPRDFLCHVARRAAKGAVYSEWAQNTMVQAQYFRDPTHLDTYLASNHFLTSINNELDEKNTTYKINLVSLETLVLVIFTQDQTVVPKESAWFGSEAVPDEDRSSINQKILFRNEHAIIPLRLHPIYQEDWIGLRELDQSGRLLFESCEGRHMQMNDCWEPIVKRFCGGHV